MHPVPGGTLWTVAADPKHLSAEIGCITILRTWGQTLNHHPHIHLVVPAGGLWLDGGRWVACRPNFFLSVHALSRLYRRLFLEQLQAAFDAGRLCFIGALGGMAEAQAFADQMIAIAK